MYNFCLNYSPKGSDAGTQFILMALPITSLSRLGEGEENFGKTSQPCLHTNPC